MTAKVISYIKQSIDGVDVHAFTVEDGGEHFRYFVEEPRPTCDVFDEEWLELYDGAPPLDGRWGRCPAAHRELIRSFAQNAQRVDERSERAARFARVKALANGLIACSPYGAGVTTRNAVRCLHCDDVIESLHRHDFKRCRCGHVTVDGGPEYKRRLWSGDPSWNEIDHDGNEGVPIVDVVLDREDRR